MIDPLRRISHPRAIVCLQVVRLVTEVVSRCDPSVMAIELSSVKRPCNTFCIDSWGPDGGAQQ